MNETYNGYTNYETWNVALWLDNDERLKGLHENKWNTEEIKDIFYYNIGETTPDMEISQMGKVNWQEITDLINEG